MKQWKLNATLALAGLIGVQLAAAQPADPDWPCVQRRVDHLSIAVMWPDPIPQDAEPLPERWEDVAEAMALRRVPVDEIDTMLDAADEAGDGDADTYARVFSAAFEQIDRQRARIIQGIVRYARGQADLAREIDALRVEFDAAAAAEEPDFDRIDELEAEIDWRERVFEDRNSALTYVCETPVLLERRAYELAQRLRARID